ncbi:unnamed protein product [Rotaria sp. Silwood1]|nr:unnamed protein product [Rotaria sp. Silwood1]CAF1636305.1 unnamed protein product [Rotaria sp. Silwood1]CAF5011391.1 unnamed protein product [Rotaria sp. Silwood1]
MFSPQIGWRCAKCESVPTDRRKYCADCGSMLTWTCTSSGKSDQRPWSEWKHTDASCIEHTGHDVEQVQELYSTCEEPLIGYCSHRNKLHASSATTSDLSPMNLLVVTLWFFKTLSL